MDEQDDRIFAEALAAGAPPPEVPAGFAANIADLVVARPRAASRRVLGASLVLAVAACALLGWSQRRVSGRVLMAAGERHPRTVLMGQRARVVLEPGTELSYRTSGWNPWAVDRVDLRRGAAFFRVDRGGAFEVHTPQGTVAVTGTCFRVQVGPVAGGDDMDRNARMGWFGGGALSMALAVVVYEGGVTLASARSPARVHLAPGEAAGVQRDGTLARLDRGAGSSTAAAVPASAETLEAQARARDEVQRLRGLLAANGISPVTGRPLQGAHLAAGDGGAAHPGLSERGNTDLTPDEWRQLAQRGELRYALPGVGGSGENVLRRAGALGLPTGQANEVRDLVARAGEQMTAQLRALYREAVGTDPGNLSWDSLQNEIRDKTPEDTVGLIDTLLAQERGGLAPRQQPRADMAPYERMMRLLVGFEDQLEEQLAALVGPADAHALLHGEHAIGGHSYGRRSTPGPRP